ncbi:pyridoxamine 5'-phosphate oxidase family protein [Roseiarcaceae bacterium H3SJ34-1]|uniref:HugZ family pyridoxamine 5'-phosphate oxidase n=1 Tax=Terripilifer ovatus TaxID=3032367 RepID=UPI003AB933F0|nr:pyridoxamine 5'-phosphate oxidase family protein [Roseiarcaceae bacterium H3SJ34-1]
MTTEASRSEAAAVPGVPPGYDAIAVSKRLLRSVRAGALASLSGDGTPFATLVNVATDFDGAPVLLMSGLAAHTKNLAADPRASILLAEGGKGDPLAHPRLTVTGRVRRIDAAAERERLKLRFLARHPKSALYADFGDFAFYRLEIAGVHLNGGFARAADFTAEAVLTPLAGAAALMEAEPSALAHMNADHAEAVRLYATKLCGEPDGRWRLTGIDPDGIDMAMGDLTARLPFPQFVTDAATLRLSLAQLAAAARAKE